MKQGKEIETEVEILLTVDHPNLARMVDAYETKDPICSTCVDWNIPTLASEGLTHACHGASGRRTKAADFAVGVWHQIRTLQENSSTEYSPQARSES